MSQVDVARPKRLEATGLVAVVIGLVLWGLLAGSQVTADTYSDEDRTTNVVLYERIADRVAAGDDYYEAAVSEQVAREFPTSPAAAVRVPTLAHVEAALGGTGSRIVLSILLAIGAVLTVRRIETMVDRRSEWYVGTTALVLGLLVPFVGSTVWFHETWALALILISLGLVRTGRWWPSVAVGVLVPFVRELGLLYVGVRFLLAWSTNRREAVAWAAGGVAFLAFYVWHVMQVADAQVADPVSSPGWLELGGWPFIVDSVRGTTLLAVLPFWVAAVVAPLALAGWAFARGEAGRRTGAVVVAFVLVFCVIGQPGNFYWGLLYAAPLLLGLAFVPRGVATLVRSIRD